MANPPLHALPQCKTLAPGKPSERQLCPPDMHIRDEELERVTDGSLAGCIIRLVAGYNPEKGTFSRTRYSYQLFSGLELGWAHAACDAGGGAEVLTAIANKLPDVAAWAWGPDEAAKLKSEDYAQQVCDSFKNLDAQPQAGNWMLAGWHAIAGRGDVQNVYAEWYWDDVVNDVIKWMQDKGLRSARTLGAATRMSNTSRVQFKRLREAVETYGEQEGVTRALEGYGHPDRTEKLNTWPCFQGQIRSWPSPSDLKWSASAEVPKPEGMPVLPTEPGQTAPPAVTNVPGIRGALAKGLDAAKKHPWAIAAILAAGGIAVAAVLLKGKKKKRK